jgi:hypothetical protein
MGEKHARGQVCKQSGHELNDIISKVACTNTIAAACKQVCSGIPRQCNGYIGG